MTGRYLTPDPIGLDGGINPFVYANNNPTRYIDPEGKSVVAIVVVGTYAAAAVFIFKDCMERCTGANLPNRCTDSQTKAAPKCANKCIKYAALLGFGSDPLGSTASTIGQEIGKRKGWDNE